MEQALWILVGLGAVATLVAGLRRRSQRLRSRDRLASSSLTSAVPSLPVATPTTTLCTFAR